MCILYSAPFLEISGYSTASRDYLKALYNNGIRVYTIPMRYYLGDTLGLLNNDDVRLVNNLKYFEDLYPIEKCVFINHATPNALDPFILQLMKRTKKRILFSVWETSHIPKEFISYLENYDMILTASEFSKNAFLSTKSDLNIQVIPHVIHNYMNETIQPNQQLLELKNKGKFIFFASLEWHIGKGYDILLRGFLETFAGNSNVILILKTYNLSQVNYKESVLNYIRSLKKELNITLPQIIPIIGNSTNKEILSLYASANAYISTSRREGFCLTASEAFGFGIPIIAPDKGGQTEFLNKDNSILIKSSWKDVSRLESERSLYYGQQWIESDLEDFKKKLKWLYKDYDLISHQIKSFINKDIEKFSEKEISSKFSKFLLTFD